MAPPNRRGAARLVRYFCRRIATIAIPAAPRARPSTKEEEFDFIWKEWCNSKNKKINRICVILRTSPK